MSISIGARGEKEAQQWLRKRGFMILERNWRNGRYEIDIIAQHKATIHFIEVKTRHDNGWSRPEDAITESKFRSLKRAANLYLAIHKPIYRVQFDLISVVIMLDESCQI
ncbi:MAG: YraN family protein [Rikenellaceae bacterium]